VKTIKMSYCIYLEAKIQDVDKWIEVGDDFSITYNLRDMFVESVGSSPKDWNGMIARDLEPKLRKAIMDINSKPLFYQQFEAENGWGTIEDCLNFMRELSENCAEYPYATIREC
jgi:hypothetical protein